MITTVAPTTTTPQITNDAATTSPQMRLFLIRGIVAIAWAAAFTVVASASTTGVTLAAGVLLVLYPLIDVAASLIDARSQHGPARRLLLAGAAASTVAAVALGVAATASVNQVFVVFGIWAAIAGAAQLIVALRRRAQLGWQVPMLLAGGVSVIGGIAYLTAAALGQPMLSMLVLYAATGGIDFIIEAGLLARRRRLANRAATTPSTR
jgi:uncharacterized membrane protein HdeD (DUF308 family)